MPRRLIPLLMLSVVLAGCYAATRVSGNRYYFVDGYKYEGPFGTFRHWEGDKNEMVLGNGFDEKTLIDEGCDGTLEEIRFHGSTYRIEDKDPTIPDLFAHASAEYNHCYDQMQIHEMADNWARWQAEGVAAHHGYFKQ